MPGFASVTLPDAGVRPVERLLADARRYVRLMNRVQERRCLPSVSQLLFQFQVKSDFESCAQRLLSWRMFSNKNGASVFKSTCLQGSHPTRKQLQSVFVL
jgi:hypothetical protein